MIETVDLSLRPAAATASVGGVPLHAAGERLAEAELRQRACTELLRQSAMAQGLLAADDPAPTAGAISEAAEAAIERLTREMKEAAKLLEFEHAAFLRDQIDRLRRGENPTVDSDAETERKQNHAQTQRRGRKYLGKR